MGVNRREFLKDSLAYLMSAANRASGGYRSALGFIALPGGLFAAPAGWKPKKKPNLVFGVLADTHMRCHYDGVRFYEHNGWTYGDAAVVIALKYFKKHGADSRSTARTRCCIVVILPTAEWCERWSSTRKRSTKFTAAVRAR